MSDVNKGDGPDAAPPFRLLGGMHGTGDELMPMMMHLTEQVQSHARGGEPMPEDPPAGMTEADRCPGCGGFHADEDDEPQPTVN